MNGTDLTRKQIKAAKMLLERRPAVFPGSRIVINEWERSKWYRLVGEVALAAKVKPAQSTAFFDLAGVPD